MVVVYISNDLEWFTYGKKYEVCAITSCRGYYYIRDDGGYISWLNKIYFKPLLEVRKNKLNKINA